MRPAPVRRWKTRGGAPWGFSGRGGCTCLYQTLRKRWKNVIRIIKETVIVVTRHYTDDAKRPTNKAGGGGGQADLVDCAVYR